MGVQVYEDVPIGEIKYLTENIGDAPISVYVIQGENGDMLVDTGFYSTYKSIIKWIEKNEFNITDIFVTHAHPDHDWNVAKLKKKYVPDVVIENEGNADALKYGYDFSIVFLPGHTFGSMGILMGNTLYVGDAYAVISGVPMMPPHVTSIKDANETYEKIKEISPHYLACGHGLPYVFNENK